MSLLFFQARLLCAEHSAIQRFNWRWTLENNDALQPPSVVLQFWNMILKSSSFYPTFQFSHVSIEQDFYFNVSVIRQPQVKHFESRRGNCLKIIRVQKSFQFHRNCASFSVAQTPSYFTKDVNILVMLIVHLSWRQGVVILTVVSFKSGSTFLVSTLVQYRIKKLSSSCNKAYKDNQRLRRLTLQGALRSQGVIGTDNRRKTGHFVPTTVSAAMSLLNLKFY